MTGNAYRVDGAGEIDRNRPLKFTFDGRSYTGFAGDTLASALLANGVHLVGRSFKYHRPRGFLGSGADEPNALVEIARDDARRTPNLPATQVELYDGLCATSQNRHPSLERDRMAVNDRLSRFLPAGFYYKTFMWPRRAWQKIYEPLIRKAAGLGVAPDRPDPDRYDHRYAHCDVLVVGSGPAGLGAALAAAQSGARVVLADEQPAMGGTLRAAADAVIDGIPARSWLQKTLYALAAMPNVRLLPRTTVFGYYPHNMIGLAERLTDHLSAPAPGTPRERLWQVRARRVIIAAGAIERPLVFPGNDRPGIMLAEAARSYLQRHGVLVGRRIVMVAAHDSAYRAAAELADAGAHIAAIVDLRDDIDPPAGPDGVRCIRQASIAGTSGRLRVQSLTLRHADGRTETLPCDAVLMAGGFTPSVHLFSQSRGTLRWDEALQAYIPEASPENLVCAGAGRGIFALQEALADGMAAGRAAAAQDDDKRPEAPPTPTVALTRAIGTGGTIGATAATFAKGADKAFVDWQNDVTARDIALATREGFVSIEHVKRYTTTGMATDQGKLSNLNALGIVSEITGRPIPAIGLTTFRPPYTPVSFGMLAGPSRGALFDPERTTAIHEWAAAQGAVFEDVGQWKRARYFPKAGEDMEASVLRECAAVRDGVGIFDASTLGKIELVGPDAAEFMNRFYVNAWTKLGVGKCRYGVLLREDGFVLDDGVVGRLAPDRFHITTTTGGAARVLSMMEDYLQTEWGDLNVWATSTTEQWSVIAVQGPRARDVLAPLVEGIDLAAEALPHMSIADATICGVPMRLMRVSFTGELGFEVNVPSGHGRMVWEAIWAAGQAHGMVAYGTETMHVLRAEKGFIIVGQETDGTATPDDVGLSWAIGKAKPDFVGKRSLARPAMQDAQRKQLVGLLTVNPAVLLEEGAQVAEPGTSGPSLGHVSSAYRSAALGRSIALAMVSGGRARIGGRLIVPMPDAPAIAVDVVDPVFVDPTGSRVNA
ncbi:MAG: sarcosine oxidase subunit alpha [Sphingopyxis macrogoltabida]|uniref:Sarcosine oxidase subunit alpha n=1 Tax=Sphingopyxis macrogoltabida TaxID=33050 RepID=A0A2W5MUW3_SPHMC|nr:MAG: sarcosine oxidase subunit alpha [Sphingopyxis macrogoltabida]